MYKKVNNNNNKNNNNNNTDFERCPQGIAPNVYADDSSITCSSTDSASLQRKIDIEMCNVPEWMRENRLSLNGDKSESLLIGHSRQQNNLNELREIEVNQKIIGKGTKTRGTSQLE